MRIEPANIEQIRQAYDGVMHIIPAEAGGVAADLKRIDPGLVVRFSERGECWIVFYAHCRQHPKHDTQCRVCEIAKEEVPPQEQRDGVMQDLVLTVRAHRGNLGVWQGLDQRVVERIREINPEGPGGYDYAKALEAASKRVVAQREQRERELVGSLSAQAAHAIRKDLGVKYKGRIFT